VYVFSVKVAVIVISLSIVKETEGIVPVAPPDHPEKTELISGMAVILTTVPSTKVGPAGSIVIVPLPVPVLLRVRVNCRRPSWVAVKVRSATLNVPALDDIPGLLATQ
jgi:hypothetical protein